MKGPRAGGDHLAGTPVTHGGRALDRERERLVALHRLSTLVAQQRRAEAVLREALQAGLRTGVGVPIMHGGRCLAILSVGSYDPSPPFDADDAQLLELFAGMVGVALVNAELNAELETRLDRIRTLSRLTRFAATC